MHGLPGEIGCHGCKSRPRRCRGIRDLPAPVSVGMVPREEVDDPIGDLRIPLQHAVEPGVVEVGEGEARARGQLAHPAHDRRREVRGRP